MDISDIDLILELQRRGYAVIRPEAIRHCQSNIFVANVTMDMARSDSHILERLREEVAKGLGRFLLNKGHIRFTEFPKPAQDSVTVLRGTCSVLAYTETPK